MKIFKRRVPMIVLIFAAVLLCLVVVYVILGQAKFGKYPEGERLARIQSSPHFSNGEFVNTVPTQMLLKGESSLNIMWKSLWADTARLRPTEALPTVKMDLTSLDRAEDMVIWLGHSSYFIQLGGKRFLVDPVFSSYGAPFFFLNTSFPGTDLYTAADMPELDFLLISHDHWDHLDYQTAIALLPKVKTVISPLGVGANFEHWGYPKEKIFEADWNSALPFTDGLTVHVVPARHFSGRLFSRNKTLWAGFVLETPERRIFLSGDSGYGPHFAEIALRFQRFDLVMLDGGQYDPRWPLIHMTPEEAAMAAETLKAQSLLLGHVGKFAIASHAWDDPFKRIVSASKDKSFRLLTPPMGEAVRLDGSEQNFTHWWEGVK